MYKNIQFAFGIVQSSLVKLWKISKKDLLTIISVMLFSQLFELIALLLPLKIILIFSSKQVPEYLMEISPIISLNRWVWILLIISIFCFLLSLILDVYVKRKVKYYNKYYDDTKTNELYPIPFSIFNLNEIFKIFANLSQVVFGLGIILYIFPLVLLSWGVFLIFQLVVIKYLFKTIGFLKKLIHLLASDPQQLIRNFMDFNFLVVFIFILLSFMIFNTEQHSVFFIFISILVARKVFSALVQTSSGCFKITQRLYKY